MRPFCLALLLCLPGLAVQAKARGTDYALICQFEVNPAGSYQYPAGVSLPVVMPGVGGTQAGADAMNACIRAKASYTGPIPIVGTGPARHVGASQSGNTMVVTTTYGSVAAAPARRVPPPDRYSNRMGRCGLTFSGGSGYKCADTARRYWPY